MSRHNRFWHRRHPDKVCDRISDEVVDIFFRTAETGVYKVLECYDDEAAIAAHRASDHFRSLGAKLGEPGRPVVSLMGDGGLQFTLPELASAVEAKVGIVVLLWNNHGYGEIKRYMERREITPLGVDIYTPDFLAIAPGDSVKFLAA